MFREFSMVFLWFSMVFYGFSVVFLWFFYGFRPPVALRTSLRLVDKHIIPSERFSDRAQYSWAKDNIQQGPELLVCAMVNDVQRLVVWISWIGTFHILSMKILGISDFPWKFWEFQTFHQYWEFQTFHQYWEFQTFHEILGISDFPWKYWEFQKAQQAQKLGIGTFCYLCGEPFILGISDFPFILGISEG